MLFMKPLPLLGLALFCTVTAQAQTDANPIRGFSAEQSAAQRALEEKIQKIPQPENIREYIRVMSEEPHHTGTEAGRRVARYVLEKFRSWGLDAQLEEFDGLMPTPRERHIELLEPERYVATLKEPAIPEDKDSSDEGQLPAYNAYSADGDVTAQLVYVNYGMPADYQKLAELGIDVKGRIVLARYGGGWRGIKPKVAAEHGAVGCIIYSDPKDDGYWGDDIYPRGQNRPEFGVQRGSTMDMPIHPGDPLTPGWGAEPGGRKLPLSEVKTLPKIPVLPISYGDATPLLRNLGGPVAPAEWRGALPLTYHVGPGPAKVRLQAAFNWDVTRGENVIARIPGSEFPDEWILYGNHHDAWVNGAADPVSGNAALMETARTLAEMVRQGWKPKRTIIFASWDAEEWGLIGSTEWAEKHAGELGNKAVVYFNSDSNRQGVLSMGGSHTLERFLNDLARDSVDPLTAKSLWQIVKDDKLENERDEKKRQEIDSRRDLRISALGSGSDYTVFIDHLALASTNVSFSGEGGGVYHSIYDSFDWYRRFGDPQFVYGRALAQFHAMALARMADAAVLPFEFTNLADTLATYLDELDELRERQQKQSPEAASVDLAPLRPALEQLTQAAQAYEQALEQVLSASGPSRDLRRVNAILRRVESAMGRPDGLPGREWYRHQIYAPGFYTGYGVKTIPGVREALEEKQWESARQQAGIFREVLAAVTKQIRAAEQELRKQL
jgi:N-acetylated-alpha-linked acidic dipeptidase